LLRVRPIWQDARMTAPAPSRRINYGRAIRGFLQVTGFLTILAAAGAVSAFLLLSNWLQYEDQAQPADFIVPLAGDDHRLIKAAELFKQGLAPKILLSNERMKPLTRLDELNAEIGRPRGDVMAKRIEILDHLGIPLVDVERYGDSLVSTSDEAKALAKRFAGQTPSLLLVTSPYQARRSKIIFARELPGARIFIVSPPEGALPERWWADRDTALLAVTEMAKLAFYWTGGAFLSNAEGSR
jgi:uncharacterized SAM-binding protein YcdF (DUF218 family)